MKIGVLPAGDEGDASARPTFIQSERRSCRNKLPASDYQESEQRSHAMKGWFVPPIVIPILIAVSLVGFVSLNAWL